MEQITIYFDGKPYTVPQDLTIMTAMEHAGYSLVRGCGCRHGFCGACATIYRVAGDNNLYTALACQTQVKDNMYVASMPFFPLNKKSYNLQELDASTQVIGYLFPEIFGCVGCNSCTKSCARSLDVMQYIAYAKRNDIAKCAQESFDCVACCICSSRCPANISHPLVGLLARRVYGKYIKPDAAHNTTRVQDIQGGKYDSHMQDIMAKTPQELQTLYNTREIEV